MDKYICYPANIAFVVWEKDEIVLGPVDDLFNTHAKENSDTGIDIDDEGYLLNYVGANLCNQLMELMSSISICWSIQS